MRGLCSFSFSTISWSPNSRAELIMIFRPRCPPTQSPHYPPFFLLSSSSSLVSMHPSHPHLPFAANSQTWKGVSATGMLVINGLGFLTMACLIADIAVGINKDMWWPKICPAEYNGNPCTRQACSMSSLSFLPALHSPHPEISPSSSQVPN